MVVNHGLFFNPNRPLTFMAFRKTENTQNNSSVYSYLEGGKKKKVYMQVFLNSQALCKFKGSVRK